MLNPKRAVLTEVLRSSRFVDRVAAGVALNLRCLSGGLGEYPANPRAYPDGTVYLGWHIKKSRAGSRFHGAHVCGIFVLFALANTITPARVMPHVASSLLAM